MAEARKSKVDAVVKAMDLTVRIERNPESLDYALKLHQDRLRGADVFDNAGRFAGKISDFTLDLKEGKLVGAIITGKDRTLEARMSSVQRH